MNEKEEAELKKAFIDMNRRISKLEDKVSHIRKGYFKLTEFLEEKLDILIEKQKSKIKESGFPLDESRERPGLI